MQLTGAEEKTVGGTLKKLPQLGWGSSTIKSGIVWKDSGLQRCDQNPFKKINSCQERFFVW